MSYLITLYMEKIRNLDLSHLMILFFLNSLNFMGFMNLTKTRFCKIDDNIIKEYALRTGSFL